jgi:hypothetical protein
MRNNVGQFEVGGGPMGLRGVVFGIVSVVVAISMSACGPAAGAVGQRESGVRPSKVASLPPGAPLWAKRDADLYLSRSADFDALARSIVTSAGLNADFRDDVPASQNQSFVTITGASRPLSQHGGVWFTHVVQGHPGYVYLDNGTSDYPVADGLIYSTSPTMTPPFRSDSDDVSDAVLSTPTPVAPHWWVAAWDPFLFYNGVSYDGRDYSAADTSMQINPHSLRGITDTIRGRIINGVTYEDESDVDIDIVDTGKDKPVCVVRNPHSVRHKASAGGVVTYRVRYSTLPGGRRIAFALDYWE